MDFSEMTRYALQNMRHRPLRSALTVLGIVVGIAAVVILVALVQGLKNDVERQLAGFGPHTIAVTPVNVESQGFSSSSQFTPTAGKLFDKDVERIKRFAFIDSLSRIISSRALVSFKDEQISSTVIAVEPDDFVKAAGSAIEVSEGRFISDVDVGSVVVGNSLAKDSFKKEINLGSTVLIGGKKYRVVGILKKSGTSFNPTDNAFIINFDDGRSLFSDILLPDEITGIRLTVQEGYDMRESSQAIEDELISAHRVTKDTKDFTLVTPDFINDQVNSITGALTIFLGAIGLIALLVGGIGIANTMYMSVLERRREIGVLKSLGFNQRQILTLFLTESALLGILGGVFGLIISFLVVTLISLATGLPAEIELNIFLGSLVFSICVGLASGYFPALDAARLDPVDALRYE